MNEKDQIIFIFFIFVVIAFGIMIMGFQASDDVLRECQEYGYERATHSTSGWLCINDSNGAAIVYHNLGEALEEEDGL